MTYAIIINKETGEFKRKIGPFANASAARTACNQGVATMLLWTREETSWQAVAESEIFQVPLDQPLQN